MSAERIGRRSGGSKAALVHGQRMVAACRALLLTLGAAPAHGQQVQVNKDNRTVAVTATERVVVAADVATVHVGFLVYGKDKDAAYAT